MVRLGFSRLARKCAPSLPPANTLLSFWSLTLSPTLTPGDSSVIQPSTRTTPLYSPLHPPRKGAYIIQRCLWRKGI